LVLTLRDGPGRRMGPPAGHGHLREEEDVPEGSTIGEAGRRNAPRLVSAARPQGRRKRGGGLSDYFTP